MLSYTSIEVSAQAVPLADEKLPDTLAPSEPLHALADIAPPLPGWVNLDAVRYTISNDEAASNDGVAPYFVQIGVREHTAEYRDATNRVAVVIGESSLTAALPFMPEETIILLDRSPEMCAFMAKYVASLREAETVSEWYTLMGLDEALAGGGTKAEQIVLRRIEDQVRDWELSGRSHPMGGGDAEYTAAHKAARQKAIIPWVGDITNTWDMQLLGAALDSYDANVTMLNLTNVMVADMAFADAASYAERLRPLPITPHAPILTTSTAQKGRFRHSIVVEATGPFFGLDNLAEHGGGVDAWISSGGAAADRQYASEMSPTRHSDGYADVGGVAVGGHFDIDEILNMLVSGRPVVIGLDVIAPDNRGFPPLVCADEPPRSLSSVLRSILRNRDR